LRHRDPHVRPRDRLRHPLHGFAEGPRRRLLSGRHLPLPLGRGLRSGAELGPRPLADAGGRRPGRQTNLRRPSGEGVRSTEHPTRGGIDVKDLSAVTKRILTKRILTKRTYPLALLAVLGAIALAVAGCGGGSSSTSESSNASSNENASSESSSGYGS